MRVSILLLFFSVTACSTAGVKSTPRNPGSIVGTPIRPMPCYSVKEGPDPVARPILIDANPRPNEFHAADPLTSAFENRVSDLMLAAGSVLESLFPDKCKADVSAAANDVYATQDVIEKFNLSDVVDPDFPGPTTWTIQNKQFLHLKPGQKSVDALFNNADPSVHIVIYSEPSGPSTKVVVY